MHVTTLSGVLRCFILLGPLRASGYIRVLFNWAWKVFFLRRNVNVRKKKIWRLMSCYNARTDVNDIKCRIEPKTVALRLLCKSVYVVVLFPSVAKKCLIWYNAPHSRSHLQSRGVMEGSGAWLADWVAGWMELLWWTLWGWSQCLARIKSLPDTFSQPTARFQPTCLEHMKVLA